MAEFKLKYVLIFNSIFAFANGLGILIVPAIIGQQMGFSVAGDETTMIRFFATVIFGMGILMLGIRNEPHSYMRQVILLVLIWDFTVMAIIFVVLCDLTNFIVWFNIILNIILVIVYGYFFIKNRGK